MAARQVRVELTHQSGQACPEPPLDRLEEALQGLGPGDTLEIVGEESYVPLEELLEMLERRGLRAEVMRGHGEYIVLARPGARGAESREL